MDCQWCFQNLIERIYENQVFESELINHQKVLSSVSVSQFTQCDDMLGVSSDRLLDAGSAESAVC